MSIRKKKAAILTAAFLLSATAGALLGGARTGEAWGWGPLDPANYWQPVSISWADTENPGHYFFRDVARQGGSVYDYTREIKSALFAGQFESILAALSEELGIDLINRIPLDKETLQKSTDIISVKGASIPILNEKINMSTFAGSPYFHTFSESIAANEAPRDIVMQRRLIASAAEGYADAAQTSISDNDATRETVMELLEAAASAKGERELDEIISQLQAIQTAGDAQISTMLAARARMKRDQQAAELDSELEMQKQYEQNKLLVIDPYDKELAKSYPYEREKAKGFVPFE